MNTKWEGTMNTIEKLEKLHAATLQKPIALVLSGLLLALTGSLLAATQSPSADKIEKEDRLASDRDIAVAIERHLTSDSATPTHLIDVESKMASSLCRAL